MRSPTQVKNDDKTVVPPELNDYYQWMNRRHYSTYLMKTNIRSVKRVGYLLCNSTYSSNDIAAHVTRTKYGKKKIAHAINDYRYFTAENPTWQIHAGITLDDVVLV